MAAQRQFPEPGPREHLRLVPEAVQALPESLDGSPARGIMVGVTLSVLGFWLPAVALWLTVR